MDDRGSGGIAALDARTTHEWKELSARVMTARLEGKGPGTNAILHSAIEREPQSPASPAYRLWAADNLAGGGHYGKALHAYDDAIVRARDAAPLLDVLDFTSAGLNNKAGAAMLLEDFTAASESWRALLAHDPTNAKAGFQAGLIAESNNQAGDAASLYRAVAATKPSRSTEDERELARRALTRLESPSQAFWPASRALADALAEALTGRDSKRLRSLASPTHFAVGPAGAHQRFEDDGFSEELLIDLAESDVTCDSELSDDGETQYLTARGWKGRWFRGEIHLAITRGPRGWQWTGVTLTEPTLSWVEQAQAAPTPQMETRTFPHDLLAPWPSGMCLRAGGWKDPLYLAQLKLILAMDPLTRWAFAKFSKGGGCGWGIPGFYYDTRPTHDDEDQFAIDFVRYDTSQPFHNVTGGTPVLAPRDGMVGMVEATAPTGSSRLNYTHIYHEDPENPGDRKRYMSRYLHLDGPYVDFVSTGMKIYTGNRLGRMDSTGRPPNLMKHLHFSIHDREVPHPNETYGASLRPSPLSGVRLDDGDNGKCVCSDNVELVGVRPMIEPSIYPVSDWIITPTAPSVNEPTPTDVAEQRFLLILSGVAIIDFKGNSTNAWLNNTVSLKPDVLPAILHACEKHRIPFPREEFSPLYDIGFHVEQSAQFSGLSSIYNDNVSNDSGFAVDSWSPAPYKFGNDILSGDTYDQVYNGLNVKIGARDSDAFIKRLSYHISLVGRIVFIQRVQET